MSKLFQFSFDSRFFERNAGKKKKVEQQPSRIHGKMLVAWVAANHSGSYIATNFEEPEAWIEAMVMLGVGYSRRG